jgi:hypothetical protein
MKNQLTLYFGDNNKYVLYAASETDFYSTSEFLNVYFKTGNDTVEGFRMERYSGTQFIKKTR